MSGGSGAESPPEGPSEEDGRAELRRVYDRVEGLLPRVEELAADRARLEEINRTQQELSETLHAQLLQAKESRRMWKTAYIQLPLLANPKIAELEKNDQEDSWSGEAPFEVDDSGEENDMEDSSSGESLFDAENSGEENDLEDSRSVEALFDVDTSGPKIQLKEVSNCVDLSQNGEYNDDIARDLREGLRKLKQAYETLTSNEDKETALLAVKDFLWSQFRTSDKENVALLNIKEVEAAQATEAAEKLQRLVEEMQVAARSKDNEIQRLQAEAVNAKEGKMILECKLLELNSLAEEKNNEIQNNAEEIGRLQAQAANAIKTYGFLREIGRSRAEAVNAKEKVRILEDKLLELNSLVEEKNKEIQNNSDEIRRSRTEAVNAKEKVRILEGNLLELNSLTEEKNKEIQNNAEEIGRSRAEAVNAKEKVRILEGNLQELNSLIEEKNKEIKNKAEEIGRSRAEAVNAKEKVRILEDKLLELNSLVEEKNEEIQKNAEEIGRSRTDAFNAKEDVRILEDKLLQIDSLAKEEIDEIQQNLEEMRLAARNKDIEIGRLQAEAVIVQERVKINVAKLLEINSLAKKENEKIQKHVKDMQVAAQNKDNEIDRLRIDIFNAIKGTMIINGKPLEMHSLDVEKNNEIQKPENGQPEILKCKRASLSNKTSRKRRKDISEMHAQPI
uniref:Uncharacterized protein n=1 Tax=Avena sativa TaxID=4498 RepID=A0ACD5W9J2_AVESA